MVCKLYLSKAVLYFYFLKESAYSLKCKLHLRNDKEIFATSREGVCVSGEGGGKRVCLQSAWEVLWVLLRSVSGQKFRRECGVENRDVEAGRPDCEAVGFVAISQKKLLSFSTIRDSDFLGSMGKE